MWYDEFLNQKKAMDCKQDNGSSLPIPAIDISKTWAADMADELVDAVAQYGFVFVRSEGTGFTKPILDNAFALVKMEPFLPR